MSDYQDYLDQVANAIPTEVWNPVVGKNVALAPEQSPQAYVQAHPDDYKGYTGAVLHVPGEARGLTTALLGRPEGTPREQLSGARLDTLSTARRVPGVWNRAIDAKGQLVDFAGDPVADPTDPVEAALVRFAQTHQTGALDYANIPGLGHDMVLHGHASPQELKAMQYILGGGTNPRAYADLAMARQKRFAPKDQSAWQKAMKAVVLAYIATGMGAAGGGIGGAIMGPGLGATMAGGAIGGGLTGTIASHGDPYQSLMGAGTGLLGGLAGGTIAPFVQGATSGLGPALSSGLGNAAAGVTAAGTRGLIDVGMGRPFDPYSLAIAGGAGFGSGALSTGLGQVFDNPLVTAGSKPIFSTAFGQFGNWLAGKLNGQAAATAGPGAGPTLPSGAPGAFPRPSAPPASASAAPTASIQDAQAAAALPTPTATASAPADPWATFLSWAQSQQPAAAPAPDVGFASTQYTQPTPTYGVNSVTPSTATYGINSDRSYGRYRYA